MKLFNDIRERLEKEYVGVAIPVFQENADIARLLKAVDLAVEALEKSELDFKTLEMKRKNETDLTEVEILTCYMQGLLPTKIRQEQALAQLKELSESR